MTHKQRLLVSVRGKNEALEAANGGAHILDVEYPKSALGTPYPLNIKAVRRDIPPDKKVSTNIGEKQFRWSTASQAALGVALAGADIIKVGLAELQAEDAVKVMNRVVRNVHNWFDGKLLIATLFVDKEMAAFVNSIDVICVRCAACEKGEGRMGKVRADIVRNLISTMGTNA